MAIRLCPKCGSDRTNSVGLSTSNYFRCDACEHVFDDDEANEGAPVTCPCCHQMSAVPRSDRPSYECLDCGHVWTDREIHAPERTNASGRVTYEPKRRKLK